MIPPNCTWSTGTGTKRSHAQIISPIRRHSFYAEAATEEEALEDALKQLNKFARERASNG
jgi:hypothetical protein